MVVERGTHNVNGYLHVRNAAALIQFYREAFGAGVGYRGERLDGSVEHAEITIGDSLLELADTPTAQPVMLHYYVPDADAVYARALASGAESLHGPMDQPYGDRETGVRDPSGNIWWISTHQGTHYIPDGLHSLTLFLNPQGASELIQFVKDAFGAEEISMGRKPDGTVYHSSMRIGDSALEISDAHPPYPAMAAVIRVFLPDVDAVYQQALRAGATSLSAPEDKPYGERNAGVTDRLGNTWYISRVIV